eukprot:3552097-Prymnesium_polylepis.1
MLDDSTAELDAPDGRPASGCSVLFVPMGPLPTPDGDRGDSAGSGDGVSDVAAGVASGGSSAGGGGGGARLGGGGASR